MRTAAYRRVLEIPGARPLYGLALVARIPVAAAPTALTLRVVLGLHQGFARSGLVAAAVALGMAAGAPFLGRLVDRRGARPVLALTTVAQAVFWVAAAHIDYAWLVPTAFVGGALSLPVFSLVRQAIATLLPLDLRQAGMALDSMGVEVSFSIGPALGVVAVTRLGSSPAMLIIGASLVIAGVGLFLLDPQTAPGREEATDWEAAAEIRTIDRVSPATSAPAATRGLGLGPAAVAALAATMGATFALSGTDISMTASMRAFGHVGLLGVVVAVWCLASLVGGFFYGTLRRGPDPLLLLVLLAGLVTLMALAGSWWSLMLLAIPSGLFCAPLLSSTANVVTSAVSPERRGRVLGIHTSALTLGNASGAPLAGWAVDRWPPASGFVTVGALGTGLAIVALAVSRRRSSRRRLPDAVAAPGAGSPHSLAG